MIEWILAFLAAPIVFWSLFVLLGIWLIYMTTEEEVGLAMFPIFLGFLLLINKFDSVRDGIVYLWNNPWDILIYFACYMVVGTVWSLFKWMLYVQDCAKAKCEKPKLIKSKITTWIVLWVPSLGIFLLNDPIRRLANWIYERMEGMYQGITNYAYRNVQTK